MRGPNLFRHGRVGQPCHYRFLFRGFSPSVTVANGHFPRVGAAWPDSLGTWSCQHTLEGGA